MGERPLRIRYAFEGSNIPENGTVLDYRAPASTSSVCGTRCAYDSYLRLRRSSFRWADISERVYLNARALDFPCGTGGSLQRLGLEGL